MSVLQKGEVGLPCGYIFTPVILAAAAWAITSGVTEGWSWEEFSRWTDYCLSKILGCIGD